MRYVMHCIHLMYHHVHIRVKTAELSASSDREWLGTGRVLEYSFK